MESNVKMTSRGGSFELIQLASKNFFTGRLSGSEPETHEIFEVTQKVRVRTTNLCQLSLFINCSLGKEG